MYWLTSRLLCNRVLRDEVLTHEGAERLRPRRNFIGNLDWPINTLRPDGAEPGRP